ncbi:MAG: PaaI family thioesterase [Proteobacteria bacterium]|nr:PaaI family thioesterase [Pseudomonadota bacterium]
MSEYEDISPNYRKALIEKMKTTVPFYALLGMEVVDVKRGWAKVKLPFAKKLAQPDGVAHGGAIFSPADAAVAVALLGMIDRNETLLTVEMKINYIKAVKEGDIVAEAKIVHKGGRTAIGDVDVWNSQGELVAKCIATYLIIRKKD